MMFAGSTSPLQIGDWLVDPGTDTISQGQETQKLEPRTMRLLMLLAQSEGAVVSADRMLAEVWPGVIVSPASVYQAVSRLRRLLRDTDPTPTYIATVPRKGYRLVAPVHPIEEPPADATVTKARQWRLLAGLSALLLLAGIALVLGWTQFAKQGPPALETTSIVVLPFIDLTA